MLTQDVTKELEAVLEQLQQQGKEPSVALVKARLKTSVPMPAIIAAIKSWKSAQRVPKIEVASQTNQDAERIAQLEATVQKLAARIDALEAQLKEKNQ
ncbi:hypothetical protein [Vibrio vulnificus]|uniref:KfrA N-terminal DNA-binding domain-containing protein n=1 Tax=Vibrio vulnificus TaxID=672 RepID=A0A2S3QWD7_VIBVL|nr:hypothetical protein [Vibrio vulnificus]EJT0553769.1 hypothetical protein [Vibrio vulnificus]ELP6757627.1 hypothetical protein [Vibrio vulnificus]MBN8083061.1 hypothetical protein [Vibrio vulnificus]MBN8126115.1 hypothetical protein [Vibrio vulnificus]MBN8130670.1 hypothetical protein [Vibrio vulnificus]